MDATVSDVIDRARLQVIRADEMVSRTYPLDEFKQMLHLKDPKTHETKHVGRIGIMFDPIYERTDPLKSLVAGTISTRNYLNNLFHSIFTNARASLGRCPDAAARGLARIHARRAPAARAARLPLAPRACRSRRALAARAIPAPAS